MDKDLSIFHNNSPEWWTDKFEKCFGKVEVITIVEDHISKGKWFVCINNVENCNIPN